MQPTGDFRPRRGQLGYHAQEELELELAEMKSLEDDSKPAAARFSFNTASVTNISKTLSIMVLNKRWSRRGSTMSKRNKVLQPCHPIILPR